MSEQDDDLRVVRRGASFVLRLHEREVQVLQWVFTDLSRLLGDEAGVDRVSQRLFPRAYLDPTEESAESQWQALTHGELVDGRRAGLAAVVTDLGATMSSAGRDGLLEVVLDPERFELWLGVLNDARLALGTALEVTAETDFDAIEPDDPRFEPAMVYDWMTHLLGALLATVSDFDDVDTDDAEPGDTTLD